MEPSDLPDPITRGVEKAKWAGFVPPGGALAGGLYSFSLGTVWGYAFGSLALLYFTTWVFANASGGVVVMLRNYNATRREIAQARQPLSADVQVESIRDP